MAMMTNQYQNERWDTIALKLDELLDFPMFQEGDALIQLYDNVIAHLVTKIHLLKFACYAGSIAWRCYSKQDVAGINFLQGAIGNLLNTEETNIEEPILYLKMDIGLFRLQQGDTNECYQLLDEGKRTLNSMTDIDPIVYASYYMTLSMFHKYVRNFSGFYNSALLFLAYIQVDSLMESFKMKWAFDLSVSALVGEKIYNFNELLAHPIIQNLRGTEEVWIYLMLQAVNAGDLARYQLICHAHDLEWKSQPSLVQNERMILEKIDILRLMKIISRRSSEDRTIPLSAIAEETQLTVEYVEQLLMKSLSVHLMEGVIDKVQGTVYVSSVQ